MLVAGPPCMQASPHYSFLTLLSVDQAQAHKSHLCPLLQGLTSAARQMLEAGSCMAARLSIDPASEVSLGCVLPCRQWLLSS